MLTLARGLVGKMLTNAKKGTYLVQNWTKNANVIYEWSLRDNLRFDFGDFKHIELLIKGHLCSFKHLGY